MRTEKGYRHWSHDISPDDSPIEAGLGFTVAWNKDGGFIGRDALLKQKETGVKKRLVQVALKDASKLLYHNEPIWRNDEIVGHIASGMFGHHLGKSLGMGYVENHHGLAERVCVSRLNSRTIRAIRTIRGIKGSNHDIFNKCTTRRTGESHCNACCSTDRRHQASTPGHAEWSLQGSH
jgi:glycine cleavage system aminomethyltransferase T